eukprot:5295793-Pyramimonas_sp.AAC.1
MGFSHLVGLALAIQDMGFSANAPVCSSWVWVNKDTSGRRAHRPLGRPRVNVQISSAMRARTMRRPSSSEEDDLSSSHVSPRGSVHSCWRGRETAVRQRREPHGGAVHPDHTDLHE